MYFPNLAFILVDIHTNSIFSYNILEFFSYYILHSLWILWFVKFYFTYM